MPYFIDSHELNGETPTEIIAQKHLHDLKKQHLYNCRKLGYWFDDVRKIAFCLFEAPNRNCIQKFHEQEHNNVPNRIIEVDSRIIDFLLKQFELQNETKKVDLSHIATQPLTTIVAVSIDTNELYAVTTEERRSTRKMFTRMVAAYSDHFKGTIINRDHFTTQLTFDSVTTAVNCALKMHKEFTLSLTNLLHNLYFKMGISGCLINNSDEFQQSLKLAKRLCYVSSSKILVTLEVRNVFQSESTKVVVKGDRIKSVSPDDVRFLTKLMDYLEKNWKNQDLLVSMLEQHLGCSKSHIFRRMKILTGQSPNSFIKSYRLSRAKQMLLNKSGNISEIAFDTGFGSPSYFSKCFQSEYGIKPSDFQMELESSNSH